MKKEFKQFLITSALSVGLFNISFAQVGINTENPNATLDVQSHQTENQAEGIIAPRLSGNDLQGKNSLYGNEQQGAFVYVLDASPEAGNINDKTALVDSEGYYYFDGLKWQKVHVEPWRLQETTNLATSNMQNIYQQGKVAIGFDENDVTTTKQFEVRGDIKSVYEDEENGRYLTIESNNNAIGGGTLISVANTEDVLLADTIALLAVQKNGTTLQNIVKSGQDIKETHMLSVTRNLLFASETAKPEGPHYAGVRVQTWEAVPSVQLQVKGGQGRSDIDVRSDKIRFLYDGNPNDGGYNFPRNSPTPGNVLVASSAGLSGDLEWKNIADIPQDRILLKSPNNTCWEITVDNNGSLETTQVSCD